MKTRFILITLFTILLGSIVMGIFGADPLTGMGLISIATFPIVGGLKSSKTLKEERGALWEKAEAMIKTAKDEGRALEGDDLKKYNDLLEQVRNMKEEIKEAENREQTILEMSGSHINKRNNEKEKKEIKNYSLLRALSSLLPNGNPLSGLEKEMHEEAIREAKEANQTIEGVGVPSIIARSEKRGFSVTEDSGTKGGELVGTDVMGLADALTDKLVMKELGVTFMTGLKGNISLPRDGAASAAWEGETDENANTDNTIDALSLSPHRLGAKSLVSKQLIHQAGNISVENVVWNKLINAVQRKLQETFINGSGSGDIPQGLLGTSGIGNVAGGTNGLAPTRAHLLALEQAIAIDNAEKDGMKFLTNSKVRYKLKGTNVDSGSGLFVWPDNNDLVGYPAVVTNAVPSDLTKGTSTSVCSAIILGVWEKAIIGQWAGLDLVLDPYTKADFGQHRLIINSWWDIAFERPEYFAAMLDALTS